ncbi:MAG: hypothetical protein HYV14_17600 [Elusimicrobia bacterium]|nr:hypothetical protein [Elusimicrobiota bacterium]
MNFTLEAIKRAAEGRGVSWSYPAGRENDEFLTLHFGGRAVTVQKTRTPFMSALALKLSTDKFLSGALLAEAGLPVLPKRLCVSAGREELRFLEEHRALVVKPNACDRGVGVTVGVRDPERLASAVAGALIRGPALLEPQFDGRELRVLVIGGRFAACYERVAAGVTGDGEKSVGRLLDDANSDPRRGSLVKGSALASIGIDAELDEALAGQGLRLDSVPAAGRRVRLRGPANISLGGEALDRTDDLHPDYAAAAECAAMALGVDVAGVDFICGDPAAPLRGPGDGVILEVNSMPGVRGFLFPSRGRPRPVIEAYLDYLQARLDSAV